MGREPQQPRARATRERVLDATVAIVLEQGAAAVTTTALAARVQVSVGTIYRYFATREAAIGEAYDRAYGALIGDWFAALDDLTAKSPAEAAAVLMDRYVEAATRHQAFLPLLEAVRQFRSLDEEQKRQGMAPDRLAAFAGLLGVELSATNTQRMHLLRHLTAELSHLTLLTHGSERKLLHGETVALLALSLERMRDA